MRIYNGKDSSIDMPLAAGQNLFINAKSVSGEFMANNNLLSMIATSFTASEIALVVSGAFEINMCSNMPVLTPMVVQSLDEAIERFAVKKEADNSAETPEPVEEEELLEELEEEELPVEEVKEEDVVEEAVSEEPKKEEKKQVFSGKGKKGSK